MNCFVPLFTFFVTVVVCYGAVLAQQETKLDSFKTVHLSSEIAQNDFKLTATRIAPFELRTVAVQDVFLSCHCIAINSERDEKNGSYIFEKNQVCIELTFPKIIQSTQQKVVVGKKDEQIRFDWHAAVVKDMSVDSSIVKFSKQKTEHRFAITCVSRSEFTKDDLPLAIFDEEKFDSVELIPTGKKHENQLYVAAFECIAKAGKDVEKLMGNFPIKFFHPHVKIDEASQDLLRPEDKYRAFTLPVYFNEDSQVLVVVNFGASRAGKTKKRLLPLVEFGQAEPESLSELIELPFSLQLSDGKDELEFSFSPLQSGKYNQRIPFKYSEQKSGILSIKGFGFGKTSKN